MGDQRRMTRWSAVSSMPYLTPGPSDLVTIGKVMVEKDNLGEPSLSTYENSSSVKKASIVTSDTYHEMLERHKASVTKWRHTDETVKLFTAYPKGLDYYMQFGPPKTAAMREEVIAVDLKQEFLSNTLSLSQRIKEKSTTTIEKREKLIKDIKYFEHFVGANTKKKNNAMATAAEAKKMKAEAEKTIVSMEQEIFTETIRLAKIKREIDYLKQTPVWVNELCKRGHFSSAKQAMDRHDSLVHSLKNLRIKQEQNLTVTAPKLEEEMSAVESEYDKKLLILRQQVINKEKRLQIIKHENNNMLAPAQESHTKTREVLRQQHLIKRSIFNMGRTLQSFRLYTSKRMQPSMESGNAGKVLADIGEIIKDYKVMLRALRKKKSL